MQQNKPMAVNLSRMTPTLTRVMQGGIVHEMQMLADWIDDYFPAACAASIRDLMDEFRKEQDAPWSPEKVSPVSYTFFESVAEGDDELEAFVLVILYSNGTTKMIAESDFQKKEWRKTLEQTVVMTHSQLVELANRLIKYGKKLTEEDESEFDDVETIGDDKQRFNLVMGSCTPIEDVVCVAAR
jgi:hypothetical protein